MDALDTFDTYTPPCDISRVGSTSSLSSLSTATPSVDRLPTYTASQGAFHMDDVRQAAAGALDVKRARSRVSVTSQTSGSGKRDAFTSTSSFGPDSVHSKEFIPKSLQHQHRNAKKHAPASASVAVADAIVTSSKPGDGDSIPEVNVKNAEVASEEGRVTSSATGAILATGVDSEAVFACEVATPASREFGPAASDSQLCVDDVGSCVAAGGDVIKTACSTSHLPATERLATGRMIQGSRSSGNQRALSGAHAQKQPQHNHSMNNHTSGVVISESSSASTGTDSQTGTRTGTGNGGANSGSVTVNVGRHFQKSSNGGSGHYRSNGNSGYTQETSRLSALVSHHAANTPTFLPQSLEIYPNHNPEKGMYFQGGAMRSWGGYDGQGGMGGACAMTPYGPLSFNNNNCCPSTPPPTPNIQMQHTSPGGMAAYAGAGYEHPQLGGGNGQPPPLMRAGAMHPVPPQSARFGAMPYGAKISPLQCPPPPQPPHPMSPLHYHQHGGGYMANPMQQLHVPPHAQIRPPPVSRYEAYLNKTWRTRNMHRRR